MQSQMILADRYMVLDQLGQGGMSVVWRGHDLLLDRPVAVKMLAASGVELIGDDLRAEALAAARVIHPNVASVFDYGVFEYGDVENGGPVADAIGADLGVEPGRRGAFIVMELLSGHRLSQQPMPMAPLHAVRVCAEVAAALAAAHAQGVVHRDVKPGNVMLTPDGVKVFDFGIAARIGALQSDSGVIGTPTYVAPERLIGGPVTGATDVYALGVMLHRLLTAAYPWPTSSLEEVVAAQLGGKPARLPAIEGLPDGVGDVYLACLAKDPAARPAANEVATSLAELAGLPIHLAEDPADPVTDEVAPAAQPRRRGALLVAGGVVSLALLGGAALATPIIMEAAPAAAPSAGAPVAPERPLTQGDVVEPASVSTGRPPAPAGGPTPGAATSSAGGLAAAPPGTASPAPTGTPDPTAPPATEPVMSGSQTFTSVGGEVLARCYGSDAFLVSWTAYSPYRLLAEDHGPGPTAWVQFRHGSDVVMMTVNCPGGTPALSVDGP